MMKRSSASAILCATLVLLLLAPVAKADPAAPSTSSPPVTLVDLAEPSVITYTVVPGDSLTRIARKFDTTRKKLESLNGLSSSKIKPGQILIVGMAKHSRKSSLAGTAPKTKTTHYLAAQPVQDFDVPASTFASCPVPEETEVPTPVPAPAAAAEAPPAATVPEDIDQPPASSENVTVYTAAPKALPVPKAAPISTTLPMPKPAPTYSYAAPIPPAPAPVKRGFFSFFSSSSTPPPTDWGSKFILAARQLGDRGIDYDEDWCPPGEAHSWAMDCSNTSRYLYRVTTGIQLPRTASDQYYYLHLQNKAWDVPQTSTGFADCNYLRRNLQPGDLLFWENTYRPERQPPITHVMIFLGTNERGEWIMAGSQTGRGGEHNRRHGGPDIYVFDPTRPCGGYSTWMGLVHHQGRFCAYGRPLEADPSKLAMAAND